MKKVGKQVLFLTTGEQNPRNGEGSIIRLNDGRIMHAFTEYCGDCEKDHGVARISACYSDDEGETWSDKSVLVEKDEKAQNIMSCNLIRLSDGRLGIIYLRKEINEQKGCYCMPVFRYSDDEGKTFSEMIYCTDNLGYYCPFNSTALVLKSGRIVFPVSYNMKQYDVFKTGVDMGIPEKGSYVKLLYSDDNGYNWSCYDAKFETPYDFDIGITEPSVYEHENGDLFVWFRTKAGHQYGSVSEDGGKTWSGVCPYFFFTTPDSPMQIKKCGDLTVAVFNPLPYTPVSTNTEKWKSPKRSPLVIAVSKNDAKDFSQNNMPSNGKLMPLSESLYYIEDDLNESYCYPAIFDGGEYILVSYYHTNGTDFCLNCLKVVKILKSCL